MSKSKAKGTAAETAILRWLQDNGVLVVRNPPAGAKDKGDLAVLDPAITVEVKNHRAMSLAEWVDQAEVERVNAGTDIGVVAHKRLRKGNPKDWYISMSGENFLKLLKLIKP
jgi:Holliday junction resolvase